MKLYCHRLLLVMTYAVVQTATGDNSEVYSILERILILSAASAVGEALKDKVTAMLGSCWGV